MRKKNLKQTVTKVQKSYELEKMYPELWEKLDSRMIQAVDYFKKYSDMAVRGVIVEYMEKMTKEQKREFVNNLLYPLIHVNLSFVDFIKLSDYEKKKSQKN